MILVSSFLSRSSPGIAIHHEAKGASKDYKDKGQEYELRHNDILCCCIPDILHTLTPPVRNILVGDKHAFSIDFALLMEKARDVRRKSERANKTIPEITLQ